MSDRSTTSSIATQREEENRAPSLAMRLYAVIWWTSFATFTTLLFGALILVLPTAIFDRRRRIMHFLTCVWGWSVYGLNPFWSLRVENRNLLPRKTGGVFVSNHDSLADILVLAAVFRPFKFVSKVSVFKVPVLGWAMTLNQYVPLKRGDKASVMAMFQQCRHWLKLGTSVLMFPEGTRSPDGNVQAFKDGAFQLACETDMPIYPIAVAGTRDALPKHGLIAPLESHVIVRALPPVYPADFDHDVARLRDHVRGLIVAEKTRLHERL